MLKVISFHKQLAMLVAFTLVTTTILLFIPPIPQNTGYHNFADSRSFFGISNFVDVASNIAFIVVGCLSPIGVKLRNGNPAQPFEIEGFF